CQGGVTWSAAPAGGTLSPSGLTAGFSASASGTYTVTATSADDASRSGSATVTVAACGMPSGTVIMHTGIIGADETWAGDAIHSVPTDINIVGAATVTIEPCAVVRMGAGASITVRGDGTGGQPAKLVAAGANAEQSVSFVRADAGAAWGFLRGY